MMPPQAPHVPLAPSSRRSARASSPSIDRAAAARPNPGTTSLHRLNRTEYANAVRDLLNVEVDASSLLPADDSVEGFDNIADVLGTSPALIERYIGAASKISRLAIGDTTMGPVSVTYKVRGDLSQDRQIEGLPVGTRGGILIRHNFPVDGEYLFKFSLLKVNFGPQYGGAAKDEQIEMSVNGERVLLRDLASTNFYYIGRGGAGRAGGAAGGGGRGAGAAGAARAAARVPHAPVVAPPRRQTRQAPMRVLVARVMVQEPAAPAREDAAAAAAVRATLRSRSGYRSRQGRRRSR
jgi:hypothetical protein